MGLSSSFLSSSCHREKVETISKLARWRVVSLDTMGPWTSFDGVHHAGEHHHASKRHVAVDELEWSYCWSDPFKFDIWEWYLVIAKRANNRTVFVTLILKESWFVQPPIARYILRALDADLGRCLCISSIFVTDFRKEHAPWQNFNTPEGPFIIDIEFLDLKISPLSGGKEWSSIGPNKGIVQSLGIKTTMPCLSRMLKDGLHTDVTIKTAGGVLKAHKAVLSASSPVFESMFLHDLKEKETSTLNVQEMSLGTCTALLGCMYGTIKQEEFLKQRLALLVAAVKYCMTDLKNYIEESLLEDVNSSNVLERLQEARLFQLENLKKACLKHLFDFGIISEEREEIRRFFRHANKELMLKLFQQSPTVQ